MWSLNGYKKMHIELTPRIESNITALQGVLFSVSHPNLENTFAQDNYSFYKPTNSILTSTLYTSIIAPLPTQILLFETINFGDYILIQVSFQYIFLLSSLHS